MNRIDFTINETTKFIDRLLLSEDEVLQLKLYDALERELMRDYIEVRGWRADADGFWRKDEQTGYTVATLEEAYHIESRRA